MKIISKIVKILSYFSFVLIILIILFIYFYFFYRSRNVLSFEFLFSSPRGAVLGEEGGIFPAIVGSIYFSLTAIILAFIPSIATAIYLKLYANKKVKKIFEYIIESIASIPSIVLGLFSYTLFVHKFGIGRSILSGGIALAIMVMPFMERRIEKAFDEVDKNYFKTSNNLGVSKSYMTINLMLRICAKEIVSSVALSFCFAMGALSPILFTGAVAYASIPDSLLKPAMALPMHLYLLIQQGEPQLDRAYATAFVELMLLLIINLVAYAVVFKKKTSKK